MKRKIKTVGVKKVLAIGVILMLGILAPGCGWIDQWETDIANRFWPPDTKPPVGPPPTPVYLWWTPPTSYADGTPLDPATEIKKYDIAISAQSTIGEENIVGNVEGGAVDHFEITSFQNGSSQWVTVRCVTIYDAPSDFASPVLWSVP